MWSGDQQTAIWIYARKGNHRCHVFLKNIDGKSETVMMCAIGTTESFKVKVGLHQGSVLSPFLFAVIMDRLTDKVRREPP